MFEEMRRVGLTDPGYKQGGGSVRLVLAALPRLHAGQAQRLPRGSQDILDILRAAGRGLGTGDIAEPSASAGRLPPRDSAPLKPSNSLPGMESPHAIPVPTAPSTRPDASSAGRALHMRRSAAAAARCGRPPLAPLRQSDRGGLAHSRPDDPHELGELFRLTLDRPRCTTSSKGRRFSRSITANGLSDG